MRITASRKMLAVMVVSAAFTEAAQASTWATCLEPHHFWNRGGVTILVLPYADDTTETSTQTESPTGLDLAGLIQTEILLAAQKYWSAQYGSPNAIRLMGRPQDCQVDKILGKLRSMERSRDFVALPDNALVFVSGRLFKEGEDFYVQSYATFRRFGEPDPGEMLELPVGERTLAAPLATQSVVFAPRHITEKDLNEIRTKFRSSIIVHERPDESSPARPLTASFAENSYADFSVTHREGKWIHIFYPGGEGWLDAGITLGNTALADRLPELKFLDGVVGYLSCRFDSVLEHAVAHEGPRYHLLTQHDAIAANTALIEYEKTPAAAAAPETVAVADELRALMLFLHGAQSREGFRAGLPLLEEAANVLASSSKARNMAAVVKAYLVFSDPAQRIAFKPLVDEVWTALALDPTDTTAVTNCWTLYDVALSSRYRDKLDLPPGVSVDNLERNKSAMTSIELRGQPVKLVQPTAIVPWPHP